jgi:hypothetical protein
VALAPRKLAKATENAEAVFLEDFGPTTGPFMGGRDCTHIHFPGKRPSDFLESEGWWFVSHPGHVKSWADLGAALAALRRLGIDPHGHSVARLGYTYELANGWGVERAPYERLHSALTGCVGLPDDSDAARLRHEWLDTLKNRLGHASKASPRRQGSGGSANHALRAASEEAANAGWPPDALAAVLLLTGADRSSWEAIRRKVVQRWRKWGFTSLAADVYAGKPVTK